MPVLMLTGTCGGTFFSVLSFDSKLLPLHIHSTVRYLRICCLEHYPLIIFLVYSLLVSILAKSVISPAIVFQLPRLCESRLFM
jgi:hypothetical protein